MAGVNLPQTNTEEVQNYSEHGEHTFCSDMTCPCHESITLIDEMNESVQMGFATVDEANDIYRGKTI